MRTDPKIDLLGSIKLFSACTHKELLHIASLADEVALPAGTVLAREGRPGAECFVIASGEASVSIDGREIARLGPGEFVGEMALLDNGVRSATVVAETPLKAVVLDRRSFSGMLAENPTVTRRILAGIAGRLRAVENPV